MDLMTDPVEASKNRRQPHGPMSGRQAEAARNDQRILDSARAVFVADPAAPITAVAKHAGVGISALYTRYVSKEELLRKLCLDGLTRFVAITEAALASARDGADHWQVFASFMQDLVEADATSLTLALAGKFEPTPDMYELANRSSELTGELFGLIRDVFRAGVEVHDLSLILEMMAVIKLGSPERTCELRRRYLTLVLDGLRACERAELPGPAPAWQELTVRWSSS
jgi:AcrR family transcriptional regulator